MPRYAFKVEYDGAPFAGWQTQSGQPSVQQAIEEALSRIEPGAHRIAAAGRTDAGVHGLGQVAHVDLTRDWTPFRLSEALNYHLKPLPVAVLEVAQVADDWHARFSAVERRYLYRIAQRRAPLTVTAGQGWHVKHNLDVAAMHEAAQRLIGQHDFTTFRSVMCQAKSPVKTLDHAAAYEAELVTGPEVHLTFRARSFMHNQVRSFVGTLVHVGAGKWTADDVSAALEARDRAACGTVAPPHGLYFTGVGYPEDPFSGG